jgi:hypothetical protein
MSLTLISGPSRSCNSPTALVKDGVTEEIRSGSADECDQDAAAAADQIPDRHKQPGASLR